MEKTFFMDMETLGLRDNSIILSIACLYVPDTYSFRGEESIPELREMGIKVSLNREEQKEKFHRVVSESTMEWWMNQGVEARKELLTKNVSSCFHAYNTIRKYLEKNNFCPDDNDVVWSRGLFDSRLWASFTEDIGEENIIPHWAWRDTRTVCHVFTGNGLAGIEDYKGIVKHEPLDDCILDYIRLLNCTKGK